jgi:hypothetical protein
VEARTRARPGAAPRAVRLGAVAETPLEWLALAIGRIPTPLIETHLAFAWARTVMVATRLGVFDALASGPRDATAVATACTTAPGPSARLLDALTGMGYLVPAGERGYALSRSTRRWLTRSSPESMVEKVLFSFDEWEFVEHYERFVVTGEPLAMHERLAGALPHPAWDAPHPPAAAAPSPDGAPAEVAAGSPATVAAGGPAPVAAGSPATGASAGGWGRYQRGLAALATLSLREVGRRTPVPRGARELLDVGGAHGGFAAAIARRHPRLRATVLDLEEAVTASAPLLAEHGLGERLRHRVGDVFAVDLGVAAWDVVFVSQLSHHLDDAANRELARRVARALRPGGVYVIQDLVRPASPREARRARLGAPLDL